jgi:hypothetical protein
MASSGTALSLFKVLIKPSLHNNITTVAGYYYNYSTKQRVSALLSHQGTKM